jgi:lysyl-tRNA synthetase class 2
MDFTEVLLRSVDEHLSKALPEAHARWAKDRPFTFAEPFVRIPMARSVEDAAKKTLIADWATGTVSSAADLIASLAKEDFGGKMKDWSKSSPRAKAIDWGNFRKGFSKCDNDGERLFALYEYLVEPFLPEDYRSEDGKLSKPVFVIDYPFEVSPLARKKDTNGALVDRFELFVHGRELCNAFSELNDPRDQAERFQAQVAKKDAGAEETMDYDADYIRALEHGMPPAAGFGMGIDRLVMMLTSQQSIRDVVFFPQLRADAREDVKAAPPPSPAKDATK